MASKNELDLVWLRRLVITALAAEDDLAEQLILKGGNCLAIAHGVGGRASWDIDYSMSSEFASLSDAEALIAKALKSRFEQTAYKTFDVVLKPKPTIQSSDPRWGGYQLLFKLAENAIFDAFSKDLDGLRKRAEQVNKQSATFKIDISRFEYVDGFVTVIIDNHDVCVYTESMVAAEKLRALCQQLPEYGPTRYPSPRARDFYDIYGIGKRGAKLSGEAFVSLLGSMFAAKAVSVNLLGRLATAREFHRPDWLAVVAELGGTTLRSFDYYFDYVVAVAVDLKEVFRSP